MTKSDPPTIRWYRTALDKHMLQGLAARDNVRGALYASFHLGILLVCLGGAVLAQFAYAWLAMFALSLAYGVVLRFSSNALHELAHGTVFSSPELNRILGSIFGFFGMVNLPYFWISHREHHKYTLHPPHDREVEEPELHDIGQFLLHGIVSLDPRQSLAPLAEQWRLAHGRPRDEWQAYLLRERASERERQAVKVFARRVLLAHALIGLLALAAGAWIMPALLLFGRQLGGLPFMLCNNTQHAGLPDRVTDFRLCCRTFLLAPPLRWLYWNMNYHIEHHMYPKVPCYRLPALHAAIRHDLPPVARGLWPVWREIGETVRHQQRDNTYRPMPVLPGAAGVGSVEQALATSGVNSVTS